MRESIELLCGDLVDMHVHIVRAQNQAAILQDYMLHLRDAHFEPLNAELDSLRRDVERLMKEVV